MSGFDEAAYIETVKRSFPPRLRQFLNIDCPIKIVDIGANPIDGPAPYAPLLAGGQTTVVGFEPNLEALAKLNQVKGPGETYLPHAVADGQRHTLHHCAMPGLTSLLEPNPAIFSLFSQFTAWSKVTRREEVDTVRLDDVNETAGLDLLKIDIQGGELMVFQNGLSRLQSGLVVHTEVEFLPQYHGQPLFSEIEMCLRAQGYMIHKLEPLVTRDYAPILLGKDPYTGHSQVFWADAIFIRDVTRLDLLTDDQILRMAVIVYDCYRSVDLALLLLREYDRRTAKGYGDRLFQVLRPLVSNQ
ncbi:FkbM family methyltransferase [Phreatobacter aquaticus]|nr:FkbM family methyltransferase [Phreatobacter aquaticus]